MSEFINTIDLQGDQETLDALVSNTQTEYRDDALSTLRDHTFRGRTLLEEVDLPNIFSIGQYAFGGCTGLTSIDITNSNSIGANAFNGASNLKDVIIGGNTVHTLSNVNAFTGILATKTLPSGGIFVPASMRDTYRDATNWSSYDIFQHIISLDECPTDDYSSIRESWSDIFAAEENGTYSTKYKIGDTKSFLYDGNKVYAEIVALDTDDLADESGKAKITWITINAVEQSYTHQSSANWTWDTGPYRTYIRNTCYNKFPIDLQNNIKEVTKAFTINGANYSTSDTLWAPSNKEIKLANTSSHSGYAYSTFSSDSRRIRYYNGSATSWWLRNCASANTRPYEITSSGASGNTTTNARTNSIILGFCT